MDEFFLLKSVVFSNFQREFLLQFVLYDEKLILKLEKEYIQNGFFVVLWKIDEI